MNTKELYAGILSQLETAGKTSELRDERYHVLEVPIQRVILALQQKLPPDIYPGSLGLSLMLHQITQDIWRNGRPSKECVAALFATICSGTLTEEQIHTAIKNAVIRELPAICQQLQEKVATQIRKPAEK